MAPSREHAGPVSTPISPIVVRDLGRTGGVAGPRFALPRNARWAVPLALVILTAAVASPVVDHAGDLAAQVVRAVVVAAYAVAGVTTAWRRPNERLPAVLLGGTALAGLACILGALIDAARHGSAVDSGLISLARLGEPVALALLPMVAMQLLLGLPDGNRRLSRAALLSGYLAGAVVGVALWTARPGLPLWPVGLELAVAVPIGLVGSQRRYTRSTGFERQRMQWFGWAVAVGLELLLVALALRVLWGWPTRAPVVVAVSSLSVAVAFTLGSLPRVASRIDRLLTHTVSVAGLSGVIVAAYLLIVVGLGRTPTHSERSLLALSMAASAVAALVYGPARDRLSQYANRIVYGEREAPDAVLRTFGRRLSRAIPVDELLLQVAESLRKTLALASAEVWTGSGGRLDRTVSVPDSPVVRLTLSPEEEAVVARAGVSGNGWLEVWLPRLLEGREGSLIRVAPTTHSGEVLGLIVAVRPSAADPFTPDDETMLTELARQVGLALHNVQLDSALQESLDEVRRQAGELQASRARIVAASDAARRQIERDLHDGAQQHLVALAVNLRLARKLAGTDPDASAEILDQLADGLKEAVQELRALAHGIYPPLLVDRGIEEALRSAAGRAALPTDVVASDLPRFSADHEAAVYFCCMEALQNAGKHAGDGATATVRVWQEEGALCFEVADTGVGFDPGAVRGAGRGAGFVNMSDRVGAVGGTMSVHSAPGRGSTVSGRLPV